MKKGRIVLITAGFLLIHSLLLADVQWLQYRTSDRARDIVGGSSQTLRPQAESLDSEKVPKTSQSEPMFFQWKTSMDKAGVRWVMLDKKHKYGLCDVLYIDSDGDGRLDDEPKYEGRQSNQYEVEFSQVPVTFAGDGSDVAYGTVTMPETITSLTVGGLNGMFERTVKDGKVTLPEGRYHVSSWNIARKDDKGVEWQLSGSGFSQKKNFDVTKDAAANLDIGEPILSKLEARLQNGIYSFNQSLIGKSGERISLTKAGRRSPAPKVHVRNKTGKYDRTFSLEYG